MKPNTATIGSSTGRRDDSRPGSRTWPLLLGLGVLLSAAAWIGRSGLYESGDDLGYYMGMVGALMMLSLLGYPLRKYVRFMHRAGPMRSWFRYHMICGIVGPLLVLLHSTFRIDSLNAGVALASMILVAASGIVGRFIYVRIHHGLYGQRASLLELQQTLGLISEGSRSRLAFVPEVETALRHFEQSALTPEASFRERLLRFLTLDFKAWRLRRFCAHELRRTLMNAPGNRPIKRTTVRRLERQIRKLVRSYTTSVVRVAQFNTFSRLFSLWHVLHVPLLYMLVISGIVHVIAVHMY